MVRSLGQRRRGAVAVVLVVVGLLLWLAYRLTIGGEQHSYAAGATAPADFALTAGETYSIGVPGGADAGVAAPGSLACDITTVGTGTQALKVTPEATDSRALTRVATFVAPTTGRAAIRCADLPAVYVDDADDADTDYAGLWLVLASIALAVGLPLLLSTLRRHQERRPAP